MVFVKVRETYDLRTVQNKMSIIGIHTPDPILIVKNFPGLVMNCKFYRPVSADVTIACASMLPADPLQVGVAPGEIAPEDLFNPILYKACTNESFSLLESRILALVSGVGATDVSGATAKIETDEAVPDPPAPADPIDDFKVYYGLLSDAHGWRHANPQQGLTMRGLKPFVHEVLASFGGTGVGGVGGTGSSSPSSPEYSPTEYIGSGGFGPISPVFMRGNCKPMPRMPTTIFPQTNIAPAVPGFSGLGADLGNRAQGLPRMRTMVAAICVPPSRLHELYYRMVVEWTLEFSEIRTLSEIAGWAGLASLGDATRFANYDFGESKTMDKETAMVDANIDVEKVM